MKLFSIIQKNFKIFIRSKISALIILLGPLVLVSLVGLSFSNTQLPGLTVGLFSPNYNEFTDSIIQKISDSKFEIKKFDAEAPCSDSVKKGDSAICLVFPQNMDKNNNEVRFIVDYSKINLVFIVVDIFSNKVSERSTELRTSYATDLLNRVVQTKDDLSKDKTDLSSLSTKQGQSKDTLTSARTNLADIRPDTDLGEQVSVADARESISAISDKITTAKSKISDAKDAVASSGLSDSDKSNINSKLISANSELASGLLYLEGNDSIASLEFMVNTIDSALENARSQLEIIKKKKSSVEGDLISLEGTLGDASATIDSLSASVNDMSSRLENVQGSDAAQLVSPIRTKIEPVTTPETHFNYLFPTLIVLVVMITSILLSSTLVMTEKKSKSMFRNFITPTSDLVFNLGTFITAFLAILLQLVIFLIISSLFFDTNVIDSIFSSSLVLIIITSTFILLGMMIGFIFKSEETYVLASITAASILLFLSSTVMPLESISDSIRVFASYTPFVVSENLLRQVMFFHFGLMPLIPQILILIAYVAIFSGVIFGIQKLARYHISVIKKAKK